MFNNNYKKIHFKCLDAVELPYRKPTLAAYRDYEMITLVSTAGVTVDCTPDLIGCAVKISGFYHGQLRGLLGNGNNEPYDDFIVPNGKIVTAEGQFGNAYKLSSSCADVTVPKHEEVCTNTILDILFWNNNCSTGTRKSYLLQFVQLGILPQTVLSIRSY